MAVVWTSAISVSLAGTAAARLTRAALTAAVTSLMSVSVTVGLHSGSSGHASLNDTLAPPGHPIIGPDASQVAAPARARLAGSGRLPSHWHSES